MRRKLMVYLVEWVNDDKRKPLILRGARQTGKTYIVRQLAKECGKELLEINFEAKGELAQLFESNEPSEIVNKLELYLNLKIDVANTILFLDEIQQYPFIFSKLRWFYEKLPTLAVVVAGSLLDFALDKYKDSMPVGRVSYLYLHPFSFVEFLWALGEEQLVTYLEEVRNNLEIDELLHQKCLEYYRQYMLIGGMPAVVSRWVKNKKVEGCLREQADIITSYLDDFYKYHKNVNVDTLHKTFYSIVYQLGNNFSYANVDRMLKQPEIKKASEMLEKAGLVHRVQTSSANGIPLGAQTNKRIFKFIFLDIGLAMHIMGMKNIDIKDLEELSWANKGALAEQICGQLLYSKQSYENDVLYFWQQTGSGTGEIDYLIQEGIKIIPIEVKAGTSGSMKSLHGFMYDKELNSAIRFDLNKPSIQKVDVKTNKGDKVNYDLLSLPLYMVEFI